MEGVAEDRGAVQGSARAGCVGDAVSAWESGSVVDIGETIEWTFVEPLPDVVPEDFPVDAP